MRITAFIFDFDGTLVDTQIQIHGVTESKILAAHGVYMTPQEISDKYAGVPSKQIFVDTLPSLDPDLLVRQRWEMVDSILGGLDYKGIDMISTAIKSLRQKGYKIAIASASPKGYIHYLLDKISLDEKPYRDFFDVIVSTEEVDRPKPFPDVFLRAAELLGKDLKECIVVGDAKSDMQASLSVPMQSIFLSEQDLFDNDKNCTRFSNKDQLLTFLIENF